jgi:sigma-B regulation protein RsbU (phosphoserine phosphatase)
MITVGAVLAAFKSAIGRDAALWEWPLVDQPAVLLAATDRAWVCALGEPPVHPDRVEAWALRHGGVALDASGAAARAMLVLGSAGRADLADDAIPSLMATVVPHVRRLIRERDGATHELAERYEEISLLYAIGELLGSGASVESVAHTVLRELAQTIGASRGALLLHEPARDLLVPAALLGVQPQAAATVSARDDALLAARAFQRGETCTEDGGQSARLGAPLLARDGGPVIAVPIRRSTPAGGDSLGTIMLAGRTGDAPFSAGDRKLVTAIASQVGATLHNARLVRAALEQEQFAREMRLAHDMQLKLLPSPRVVEPEARAAARVVPAESVGGDFYLLARLDAERTGVVIGDVSGHGYQAALVMALAMSATAIHVQAVIDPGVALEAVRHSLADELESTEMSITLFYGVIDEGAGALRYANAGHPHAFVLRHDGRVERLAAQVPPLGFAHRVVRGDEVVWEAGDRLLLFTDGVPDARNIRGERFGEAAVLRAAAAVQGPAETLEAIYAAVRAFTGGTALLDDLAVVVVDRAPSTVAADAAPAATYTGARPAASRASAGTSLTNA